MPDNKDLNDLKSMTPEPSENNNKNPVRKAKPQSAGNKNPVGTGDGSDMFDISPDANPDNNNQNPNPSNKNVNPSDDMPVNKINPLDNLKHMAKDATDGLSDLANGGATDIMNNAFTGVKSKGIGMISKFNGVITKTSVSLGVSKPVAGGIMALVLGLGGGGAGLLWSNYNYEQKMMAQDVITADDCKTDIKKMNSQLANMQTVDASTEAKKVAGKVWVLFKSLGATDEQAAGFLGNLDQESEMDPTCIETIYSEPFVLGPKKTKALADYRSFTENVVFPSYRNISLNKAFYRTSKKYGAAAGIGLYQATGMEVDVLENTAQSIGKDKTTIEAQMVTVLTTHQSSGWLKSWFGQSVSVPDATRQVLKSFLQDDPDKGSYNLPLRVQKAQGWYNLFKGKSDSEIATLVGDDTINGWGASVMSLAQVTGTKSLSGAISDANKKCNDKSKDDAANYSNGDLAKAAAAYAWETVDMGRGNKGTQLYVGVHDSVFPGDGIYMSCDRSVGTAVRWSGADDNYPQGRTDEQDIYVRSHPDLWDNLGTYDDLYKSKNGDANALRDYFNQHPGLIFITTGPRKRSATGRSSACGHTVIWVTNEIIKQKYPASSADIVSGSLNTRSPGCEIFSPTGLYGEGYELYEFKGQYNGKYKNVADGKNWSGTS